MFCTECGTANTGTAKFCHSCGFRLAPSSAVTHRAPTPDVVAVVPLDSAQYATFGKRIAAFLIDALVLNGVSFVVAFLVVLTGELMLDSFDSTRLYAFMVIASFVVGWLYYAGLESSVHQATVGKRVVGIRVADGNRERISFFRATGRHFGKFLSALTLGVGFVMAASTKRHQTLHDLVAGCVVLRTAPRSATSLTLTAEPSPSLSASRITVLLACGILILLVSGGIIWSAANHDTRVRAATQQQAKTSSSEPDLVSLFERDRAAEQAKAAAPQEARTAAKQSSDVDYKEWLAELRSAAPAAASPAGPPGEISLVNDFESWRAGQRQIFRGIESVNVAIITGGFSDGTLHSSFPKDGLQTLEHATRQYLHEAGLVLAPREADGSFHMKNADSLIFDIFRSKDIIPLKADADTSLYIRVGLRLETRPVKHPSLAWDSEVWGSLGQMERCRDVTLYRTAHTLLRDAADEFLAEWRDAQRN